VCFHLTASKSGGNARSGPTRPFGSAPTDRRKATASSRVDRRWTGGFRCWFQLRSSRRIPLDEGYGAPTRRRPRPPAARCARGYEDGHAARAR
jgi:hypothetical protein